MRFRLRTLLVVAGLLPIPLAVLSANFMTLPLRESDKAEAARNLIAWVVEDRPVPGFDEPVADGQWIRKRQSLVVACGFVPSGSRLSDDTRVRLVAQQEFDQSMKKPDFDSTAYIEVVLKSESPRLLVLEVSNYHGSLGAQGYRFEFRRKVWGLRGWGKLLWVS
jgi:hypothetical protein